MENLRALKIEELLSKDIECECGEKHRVDLNVYSEDEIVDRCRNLVGEDGEIILSYSDKTHENYVISLQKRMERAGYTVNRSLHEFGEYTQEVRDCEKLIIAVGGEWIINRAKLTASSYGVYLFVVSTTLDLVTVSRSCSVIDYGGVRINRPAHTPDGIFLSPILFIESGERGYGGALCELYSKAVTACDYAYLGITGEKWCSHLVNALFSSLEKLNALSFDRRVDCVEKVLEEGVKLNAYLYCFGIVDGGENQLATTVERFAKERERKDLERGEILFMSAVIISKIYTKFLSKTPHYGVYDGVFDLNQGRIVLKMSEREVVEKARGMDENYKYKDYKVSLHKEKLKKIADRAEGILKVANLKIKRFYSDGGFHTRYFLTSGEMLSVIPLSSFYHAKESLLTFIKDRGLLEFAKSV